MRLLICLLFACLASFVRAQHGAQTPAFDEASSGAKRFQLAPGLKLDVWAAEPQLSNGVAFSFDGRGRVFVAETHRYGLSVFDITKNTNWLLADMAFRSPLDRGLFLTNEFATNLTLLTRDHEQVRLVEDRDGDGRADHSKALFDRAATALDGTAAGVLALSDAVYFGSIPDLWRAPREGGKESDGSAAMAWKRLAAGFGVHIGVTGHDLHGLIKGFDGRIYMSFGDRGACITNAEGVVINLPDTGGVLRCEPDGTRLEVFCSGLRNPQELAFDDLGNLWTVDNDTAGADPCRVLHLVEGGDYGWRTSYQHMEGFGPWVLEELWKGGKDGILPLAGIVSQGPSGLAFFPGTGWGSRMAGKFVHCDFPGGVWAFSVKPKGASYEVAEKEKLLWNCWPPDVDFGPDGALYVLDWIQGWNMPQRGRIYRITAAETDAKVAAQAAETRRLLGEGVTGRPAHDLAVRLSYPDRRVRLEAQWELARRKAVAELRDVALHATNNFARAHAVYGLGQVARSDRSPDVERAMADLVLLVSHPNESVSATAMSVLAEAQIQAALPAVAKRLSDSSPVLVARAVSAYTRLSGSAVPTEGEAAALFAAAKVDDAFVADELVKFVAARLRRNDESGRAVSTAWMRHADPQVRKVAALACARSTDSSITNFLSDSNRTVMEAAGRAIHDVPIVEGLPALAQWITSVDCPTNLMTRIINAAARLGTPRHAQMLANFAKRRDVPDFARVAALDALADWTAPSGLDKIVGLWRPAYGGVRGFEFRGGATAEPAGAGATGNAGREAVSGKTSGLLAAAMEATGGNAGSQMALPKLPADLGRSISFDEASGFKRNAEAARRAFLKVAGEILDPATPDEYGLRSTASPSSVAVQLAVVDAANRLRTKEASTPLFALFEKDTAPVEVRRAIVGALASLNAAQAGAAVKSALANPQLESAAIPHLEHLEGGDSALLLSNLVTRSSSREKRATAQVALAALGRIDDAGAVAVLSAFASRLEQGVFPKWLELDLREAASKTSVSNRVSRLRTAASGADLGAAYGDCLEGGDAVRGRRVFRDNPVVQCLRCHQAEGEGGTVGPKLDGIGGRQSREYLLESIARPSARISSGFETVALTLNDGGELAGVIKSEADGVLVLETTGDDGLPAQQRVKTEGIKSRERGPSAMPDGLAEQLNPIDLRDLIEYLATLK
jgi:quinoprotein glucose dehydrogenase